jgi:hypothetical protein
MTSSRKIASVSRRTALAGVRMTPGKPGYEEVLATQQTATPEAGTPTS